MASDRLVLGVRPNRRTLVHPDHRLAIVAEAPGHDRPDRTQWDLFVSTLGWTETQFLKTFSRATVLPEANDGCFPLRRARDRTEKICQDLGPRPLLLIGQGVGRAFRFPGHLIDWHSYALGDTWCHAAVIPEPSSNFWKHSWRCDVVNTFLARAINDLN